MVFLLGIVTIIQSNLAYAASSEKIPLIQKFEQFSGQKITGFCNLQYDEEGNLDWRIKVNGLVPKTQGHFDLGHWAGEIDVPFTADDDGKADSKNNIILANHVYHSSFSQFAKCQVHLSGFNDFTSPVIALGVPGSSNVDVDENKKSTPIEEKFFLFATLEYVFAVLMGNNVDDNENNSLILPEKPPPSYPIEDERKGEVDSFSEFNSVFSPPSPKSKNPSTSDKGTSDKGTSDKGTSDKGTSDKGTSDKGTSDKGTSDKGTSDKGTSDKGTSDKGTSDKGTSDKGNGENGNDQKRCNPIQQKKGSC